METINRAGILEKLRPGDIPGATKLFSLIESDSPFNQLYGLSKLRDLLQFEYYSLLTCPPGLRKEVHSFIEQLSKEIKKLSESLNPVLYTANFIELLLSEEIQPNRKTIKLGSLCEELAFIEKVKLDLSDIAEEHRKSPEYNRSDYLESFEVCKESDSLHFGTPFRIVTDFEQLLNQIGKEIEQEQEQPETIPPRGTHPPTYEEQEPGEIKKLIWVKDSTTFYRVLASLIDTGCFGEIGKAKSKTSIETIIKKMNQIIQPKTKNFSRPGYFNRNINADDKDINQIIECLRNPKTEK